MKTVNLQVRINEDLKQEVSSILKAQGLSYTSMLDALFRQIIKERRIPFAIALPTTPTDETPMPSTLNNDGTYEHPRTTLKASETVTLVSKQIQFAKDIPPTIHRPEWIDAINDDLWTKEEFNKRIEIGLNQAENGIGESAEKVFNELLKDL